MSLAMNAALDPVLARGDVWLGDRLAVLPETTVPTGFPALDAELPGGGWPCGQLTEMLVDGGGFGELSLWLPALAHQAEGGRPIALVAPPCLPYLPAWQRAGITPAQLVLLAEPSRAPAPEPSHRGRGRLRTAASSLAGAAWSCEQLLASGAFAAVLAWLAEPLDARALRRLQVAVHGQPTLACLWRPRAAARQASPAPLRVAVDPAGDANAGLCLRLLKRRGPPAAHPVLVLPPRPGRAEHALACLRTVSSAPRSPAASLFA